MTKRINKTITQKLSDLDDHLFLLRENLYRLNEDDTHLKIISAELRVLACSSRHRGLKLEGLLWRLVDEFGVSDLVHLHVAGNVNKEHALAKGLHFAIVPLQRAGYGDPRLPPHYYSLKEIMKKQEAVYIAGKGLSHEYLIKAVAQQMGSAHEDEGIEPVLVELGEIFINGVQPYVSILSLDAELILEVGERVLEKAEKERGFTRKRRVGNYGDISIVVRFAIKKRLKDRISLFKFKSFISNVQIKCFATSQSIVFLIHKNGVASKEIHANYPENLELNKDAVFVLSYCSRAKQFHAITNGEPQDEGILHDIGWLHANELKLEEITKGYEEFVYRNFLLLYGRLLSPKDTLGILELPPDGHGIWMYNNELEEEGVFPSS